MSAAGYVLEGRVVTMNDASEVLDDGRVYVRGDRIVAVLPSEAPPPQDFDETAPLIRTGGTIYPGLIELHNHLAYNALPLWLTPRRYTNRGQWGGILDYRRRVSGPMGVLGKVAGYIEAVVRYAEVKALIGGVTTSQGIALYSNAGARRYYHGLVRNVEQPGVPGLPRADTRIADVEAASAAGFLQRLRSSSCLLLHLSEGVDERAREHFRALKVEGRTWAITPALAGIHCAGLRGRDFATLRSRGGSMVWSPLSNLLLYGDTTDIARAFDERVTIGIGSDWSPSGSKNLLCELKVAWLVGEERGAGLAARDVVAMATRNAARILKWEESLGTLEGGKLADLLVVAGRTGGDPYEHLLRARETSVTLVVIDGRARYGQPQLLRRFGHTAGGNGTVEEIEVGGSARWLDLHDEVADPVIGTLSLGEARDRLADGLRRLPELASQMEQTGVEAALLGTTSAAPDEPGRWFLELDHEPLPGFEPRPQLPFGGVQTGIFPEFVLAAPLSEILEPMDLDPLTVADDGAFFDRLAESVTLPAFVVRELPRLYGERARTPVPPPVAEVPTAEHGAHPVPLAGYLPRIASRLTAPERRLLVEQAMVLLGESYVHLQLKRSMHAVEPIQRLRMLRYRLSQRDRAPARTSTPAGHGEISDFEFHREMTSIFTSVRDLHTNYLLPVPWRDLTAFLPFLVEEYVEDGEAHYLVTHVAEEYVRPGFEPGVEVLHWNGMPIRRAVATEAERQAGSNEAARWAHGLDALTIRPLVRSLPPDEDWVTVTYRGLDGAVHEERWDWLVWAPPLGAGVDPDGTEALVATTALGYDLQTDLVNQARKVLFARRAFDLECEVAEAADRATAGRDAPEAVAVNAGEDLPTTMPAVFSARTVQTRAGTFGYVRIFTFNVPDADAFVSEFVRLAALLPPTGLVLDVRGNGGGLILAAERLLQTLTPQEITPSRAQFMTTPLMLDLCERHAPSRLDPGFDLDAWVPSMRQAVATGAVYSQARALTDEESANAVGQTYQGPVVLVTDALCYSATDMFAAGFADHGIGTILGVHGNTGAGGANVWTHELLRRLMDAPHPHEPRFATNPFRRLPHGAGMRVSVRRTTRVGTLDGMPLEDLGVEPDERHHMTRDDLLHGNTDLVEHAGRLLAAAPVHRLDLEAALTADGMIRLAVRAEGVDRADVWVDARPSGSFEVDGTATHRLRSPVPSPRVVELRGYLDGRLLTRTRQALG